MDYHTFNVQDFLADEHFTQWVLKPDAEHENFWTNWIMLYPEKREIIGQARQILENIDFTETWTSQERSQMWQHIQAKTVAEVIPISAKGFYGLALPYAAAVALLIFAAGWFYLSHRPERFRTPYGKQMELTLPDGSQVSLNANSEINFHRDFDKQVRREVWIKGEAFFNVAKVVRAGKKIPFTLHTDQLDIEVLGTAFNITNRHGRVDVALQHGVVKLTDAHNASNMLMLKPGELATQAGRAARLRKEAVDVNQYSCWRERTFQYKGRKLSELAGIISDSYGLEIIIENQALKEETFTGSFPTDSVGKFFEKLVKLYPMQIDRKQNTYYLR